MKKLVKGIIEFRKNSLERYREKFAHLALEQRPDTLFIACSDSRVVPNLFASTDPGDLFVVRNVGNLVPCCGGDGHSSSDESEGAAIEFALHQLNVIDIIVCGHSQCGAMEALIEGREKLTSPNLRAWLRHGEDSLKDLTSGVSQKKERIDELSKKNILKQLEHLKTYPEVQRRISEGRLNLHAWWFDLATADVYRFDETANEYTLIS